MCWLLSIFLWLGGSKCSVTPRLNYSFLCLDIFCSGINLQLQVKYKRMIIILYWFQKYNADPVKCTNLKTKTPQSLASFSLILSFLKATTPISSSSPPSSKIMRIMYNKQSRIVSCIFIHVCQQRWKEWQNTKWQQFSSKTYVPKHSSLCNPCSSLPCHTNWVRMQ